MTLSLRRAVLTIILLAVGGGLVASGTGFAADEPMRKVTKRVAPVYPIIARRLKLSGTVKLTAVVAGGGQVTNIEIIGGHPILILAAQDAAKQFVFESASAESREILTFVFAPQ
jgi:outer membrane biosynthesis protein TonB